MQLSLFQDEKQSTLDIWSSQADQNGYKIVVDELETNQVTFLGGLDERIHSWFRLTPSFSPHLVRLIFNRIETKNHHLILDPFAGAFTTLIESKMMGLNAIGVEINPVFTLVGNFALDWEYDINELKKVALELLENIKKEKELCEHLEIYEYLRNSQMDLPLIYNVFRWWRKDVLKDLLIIKRQIKILFENTRYFKLLWGTLCSIIIEVANIHRRHPTLSFADRSNEQINAVDFFQNQLEKVINDISCCSVLSKMGNTKVIHGDSTKLPDIKEVKNIDRVVTSPPYPNRFSYIWETRPQLFFMDLVSGSKEVTDLDLATIGGTWGRATSILQKGIIKPIHPIIEESIKEQISVLRNEDNLMCNYAIKYFNMMFEHLMGLTKVLNKNSKCAYVVGNSRLKGQDFFTDIVLANIMSAIGFTVNEIWAIRKRLGRKELYESVLISSWNG